MRRRSGRGSPRRRSMCRGDACRSPWGGCGRHCIARREFRLRLSGWLRPALGCDGSGAGFRYRDDFGRRRACGSSGAGEDERIARCPAL